MHPTKRPCHRQNWIMVTQLTLAWTWLTFSAWAQSFDAVPFSLPLPEGNGVRWEDPREIHRVVIHSLYHANPGDVEWRFAGH